MRQGWSDLDAHTPGAYRPFDDILAEAPPDSEVDVERDRQKVIEALEMELEHRHSGINPLTTANGITALFGALLYLIEHGTDASRETTRT